MDSNESNNIIPSVKPATIREDKGTYIAARVGSRLDAARLAVWLQSNMDTAMAWVMHDSTDGCAIHEEDGTAQIDRALWLRQLRESIRGYMGQSAIDSADVYFRTHARELGKLINAGKLNRQVTIDAIRFEMSQLDRVPLYYINTLLEDHLDGLPVWYPEGGVWLAVRRVAGTHGLTYGTDPYHDPKMEGCKPVADLIRRGPVKVYNMLEVRLDREPNSQAVVDKWPVYEFYL